VSDDWHLGPFTTRGGAVLTTSPDAGFACPVSGEDVRWAAKDVFNPGGVVRDGKIHLLVRAEDSVGRYAGTSRIGVATSADGTAFELEPEPVIFPANDVWQAWEWPGGCEDPRVVESPDGGFVCLYTAFDGKIGTLFVATSDDLRAWTKHGPAFADTSYAMRSSKSGSIVTEVVGTRVVASRRQGKFWMYWGEGTCFAAVSDDLLRWSPVEFDATRDRYLTYEPQSEARWAIHVVPGHKVLRPLLFPRSGRFDSLLVEPGPPALQTEHGIVLLYNGANHFDRGDPSLPAFSYQPGQALFDSADPASCIARDTKPFLRPDQVEAQEGQVGNVCFAQALVLFDESWHLYFGMADSRIGCAVAPGPAPEGGQHGQR
jgi:beta-1,2-mannosidase